MLTYDRGGNPSNSRARARGTARLCQDVTVIVLIARALPSIILVDDIPGHPIMFGAATLRTCTERGI